MDTDNNIDLNKLWKEQSSPSLNIEDINSKSTNYKKKNMRNSLFVSLGLIVGIAFIIWIWVTFQPEFLSTKVGIIMMLIGMLIFAFSSTKYFSSFQKLNNMNSNKEYLNNLKKIKKQQNQLQTKILSLYYFLLAIGIALYTYEYAMMMPNPWGIVTYALTFSWIALAWFYIRPKKIKSDKKKLDELISHYDSIDAQFEVE